MTKSIAKAQEEFRVSIFGEKLKEIAALKAAKTECEKLLKEADVLFNQTAEMCEDVYSDEWIWKWKVKYYFEETDIPVHPLPEDMK